MVTIGGTFSASLTTVFCIFAVPDKDFATLFAWLLSFDSDTKTLGLPDQLGVLIKKFLPVFVCFFFESVLFFFIAALQKQFALFAC